MINPTTETFYDTSNVSTAYHHNTSGKLKIQFCYGTVTLSLQINFCTNVFHTALDTLFITELGPGAVTAEVHLDSAAAACVAEIAGSPTGSVAAVSVVEMPTGAADVTLAGTAETTETAAAVPVETAAIHLAEVYEVKSGTKVNVGSRKRKITASDILEQQYKALLLKQENLRLKKRKLELQVYLLEQRTRELDHASTSHVNEAQFITLQLSPILQTN